MNSSKNSIKFFNFELDTTNREVIGYEELLQIQRLARLRIPRKIEKIEGITAKQLKQFKKLSFKYMDKNMSIEEKEFQLARELTKRQCEEFILNEVRKTGKIFPPYFFTISRFRYWDAE